MTLSRDHDRVDDPRVASIKADAPADDDPMPLPHNPVVLLLAGIFAILLGGVLYFTASIAIPIFMAFMLYLVLQPAMRLATQRLRLPRGPAAVVVLVALIGGLALLVTALSGPLAAWVEKLPATMARVEERLSEVSRVIELVQRAGREVEAKIGSGPQPVAVAVAGDKDLSSQFFAATRVTVVGLVTTVILLFFLLISGDVFLRRLVEILPTFAGKKQVVEITTEIRSSVSGYLLTITAMNAVVGAAVGLAVFACGLPDALLWGSLAFLCNYIPFIGPAFCGVLLAIVSIATFADLWLAALPVALYFAIHIAEGQFITPLLLARRFILNPVIVIVSVVFWYWLWGIPGAVLAVPMLATIKIICDRIRGLAAFGHFLAAEAKPG